MTFTESGLPSGAKWFVNVSGAGGQSSTTDQIVVGAPNGSHGYRLAAENRSWGAAPGELQVSGGPLAEPVHFEILRYSVTLSEMGLPVKILEKHGWLVELNGSVVHEAASTIRFTSPNGSYPMLVEGPAHYGWSSISAGDGCAYTASGGLLSVQGSAACTVDFAKSRTSTLTFHEKGLAKQQTWCLQLDGYEKCATSPRIKYANLTSAESYAFGVVSPLVGQNITAREGKTVVAVPGSLNVARSARVTLTFVNAYAITFTETGLLSGTWSVTVKGVTKSSPVDDPIVFELTNRTYGYRIGVETGYRSSGVPPKVTVNGAGTTVAVTFSAKA